MGPLIQYKGSRTPRVCPVTRRAGTEMKYIVDIAVEAVRSDTSRSLGDKPPVRSPRTVAGYFGVPPEHYGNFIVRR